MSTEEVQGLIGEMMFLKDSLIPKYGELKAIQSWTHPVKGKQDFMIDDTWYEVKTIKSGSNVVEITSLEQLDSEKVGSLNVIVVKSSTIEANGAYNIKKIHSEIASSLTDPAAKDLFVDKTIDDDIDNDSYNSIIFEKEDDRTYVVTGDFPRLTPNNVSAAISKASYGINLGLIEKYKV